MSHELRTVVVIDTGHERHCYETAIGVWREDNNRKHHSTKIVYEDPDTGEVKEDSIYGGRILYDAPTYDSDVMPSVDELLEETTTYDDESYWGHE
jgi:hypothetical protein